MEIICKTCRQNLDGNCDPDREWIDCEHLGLRGEHETICKKCGLHFLISVSYDWTACPDCGFVLQHVEEGKRA